ncbi:MAG: hypothetical protein M0P95_07995 [Sulfuritalea sp.]|jgi:hypothetical protein|nr:hypothetical protein [Sulfuritalea sp.]
MPSFIRDVMVRNVVINDEAIQELNAIVSQRVAGLNASTADTERQLRQSYVVRFDNRGYRTFSAEEAWGYYKTAATVERVIFEAVSRTGLQTNDMIGEKIEVRLDSVGEATSHIIVGGDSKDWVETTFTALEAVLARRRHLATAVVRTQWMALVLQLVGVVAGVLLCLWLATLSAPYLTGIEYPRALAFAFWFLVYSNLWAFIQQRALAGIGTLFPNVRFSRESEHWTQKWLRRGLEGMGIALFLWALGWLTKWATAVIAPFVTTSM